MPSGKKTRSLVLCSTKSQWLTNCFIGNILEYIFYLSLNVNSFSPSVNSSTLWNPAVENVTPLTFLALAKITDDLLTVCSLCFLQHQTLPDSSSFSEAFGFKSVTLHWSFAPFWLLLFSILCRLLLSTCPYILVLRALPSSTFSSHPRSHHILSLFTDSSESEASTTRDIPMTSTHISFQSQPLSDSLIYLAGS